MQNLRGLQIHPHVQRRHRDGVARRSHFDGPPAELVQIVLHAMCDESNILPGKFKNTHVVLVAPDKFRAPGERLPGGLFKPAAGRAQIVVWSASALEAEGDPLAAECDMAIVSIRAEV